MRTRSLSALTADILRWWPGATVWGKGDPAHQASTSDHNEDDTPGSKSEQADADSLPEHRALDVPRQGPFKNMAELRVLRARLTDRPANRARLRYVILEQNIWRKRNGWKREDYGGEFHDHLHASQDVADDDNGAGWDIGPDAPEPVKKRRSSMSTLYFNRTTRKEWALAGDSPGTPANWLTTAEQGVANAWAGAHGSAVELEQHSYDDFRERYTAPLTVGVERVEGGSL